MAAHRPLLDDREAIEAQLGAGEEFLRAKGVETHTHLQRGDPALLILYVAVRERAGLIVLPASTSEARSSVIQAQVWDAVAHNAQCSVLIAREPADVS